MLRFSRSLLATVSSGKGGGSAPNKKKAKWIDRRYKTPAHGGKEVFPYNAQPACLLCHMKFKYKQDYLTHTESEIHKDRVKYKETMDWWKKEGCPALSKNRMQEWEWFVENVAAPEAARLGVPVEDHIRAAGYRMARISESPVYHTALQAPFTKPEVAEPRDNRWPFSPKW